MIILGLMPKNGGGPYYNVGYVVRVLSDSMDDIVIVRRSLVKMVRNAYSFRSVSARLKY
jgi:hypothetical protein